MPTSATILDLYRLKQGPEETVRHYIWRFRGVIDRIPLADLQEISVTAVFHANVRNPMAWEKLSVRAEGTLEDLWKMADRCTRAEEAAAFPPREVR